ncbi:MAG: hypothetical protein U0V02_11280 [Anaerolineales bacterium]
MKLAREQGYSTVSATTVKAAGILEPLGWEFIIQMVKSHCTDVNYGLRPLLSSTGT